MVPACGEEGSRHPLQAMASMITLSDWKTAIVGGQVGPVEAKSTLEIAYDRVKGDGNTAKRLTVVLFHDIITDIMPKVDILEA